MTRHEEYQNCPRCQRRELKIQIGQASIGRDLRWFQSARCNHCGFAQEMDDTGFPPDEVRDIILSREGVWTVVVDAVAADRLRVSRELARLLGLSIHQALELSKKIPGDVYCGTPVEAKWVSSLLRDLGVESRVVVRE